MLTFRNTNMLFTGMLVILIVIHVYAGIPFFVYPLLVVSYSLVLFYGCAYIRSGFFMPVFCAADTDEKVIAISFDDGPVVQYTPDILNILKEENIEAAFFFIGNRIAGNEGIMRRVVDEGHIAGNHSYSHAFWFDMFSSKKMLSDLRKMDDAMKALTGLQPKLFRPPYGVMNPNLKKAITSGSYIPVGWSVRSMDTVIRQEDKLFEKISKGIRPGAVFLFHDTSASTLNVLPRFIKEVKNQGYHVVRLDKMLHLTPYA